MPKALNLSLLCMLLLAQYAYSNTKLFPGYYLDKNGDSVFCEFNFNDSKVTPDKIVARVSGKTLTLTPADTKRFEIFGYGDYISAPVSYHVNDISGLSVPEQFSDSIEAKQCFLKVLTSGVYALYELVLPKRPYYFISERNSPLVELIYRVKRKELRIDEDSRYRNTIFSLLEKEGLQHTYVTRLNTAGYNSKDIGSFVRALNSKHPKTKDAVKTSGEFQIDVFVGGISNSFPTAFNGRYSTGNKFDKSVSFSGGLNFLYTIPSRFKSFSIGVSAGYDHYESATAASGSFSDSASINFYNTTTFNEKFSVKNTLILINFYGLYIINPLNRIKVYVKGGVNCNITISDNQGILTTYSAETKGIRNGNIPTYNLSEGSERLMQLRGMYFNVRADIGIMSDRHKLEFGYFTPATLNPGTAFKVGMIGGHYYYTILK